MYSKYILISCDKPEIIISHISQPAEKVLIQFLLVKKFQLFLNMAIKYKNTCSNSQTQTGICIV